MGTLEGTVALVTGAARGQGRSHAIRLACEGADIIALDICAPVESAGYPMATRIDLDETVARVESIGRRIIASETDVRKTEELGAAVDYAVAEFGSLDIVVANAGIVSFYKIEEMTDDAWNEMIDINLTGTFKTIRAAVPHIKAGGRGGSIVITSSTAGLRGMAHLSHYTASKHGLVGLVRSMANELAGSNIRVNSVHPTTVNTQMIHNEGMHRLFGIDSESPSLQEVSAAFAPLNALKVGWIEPEDVSDTVAFLVSDGAKYITGAQLPVDAGSVNR